MGEMIKINGTVLFAKHEENKQEISIAIAPETGAKINKAIGFDNKKHKYSPVKVGESGKFEGQTYVKATTNFPVKMYDEKVKEINLDLGTLGEGSVVEIAVVCGENTYKGKTGIVARLSAVRVIDYKEFVPYVPYEDENCATF